MVSNHHMNQYWLTIDKTLSRLFQGNVDLNAYEINLQFV